MQLTRCLTMSPAVYGANMPPMAPATLVNAPTAPVKLGDRSTWLWGNIMRLRTSTTLTLLTTFPLLTTLTSLTTLTLLTNIDNNINIICNIDILTTTSTLFATLTY